MDGMSSGTNVREQAKFAAVSRATETGVALIFTTTTLPTSSEPFRLQAFINTLAIVGRHR